MFPYANPDDYARRLAPLAEEDGMDDRHECEATRLIRQWLEADQALGDAVLADNYRSPELERRRNEARIKYGEAERAMKRFIKSLEQSA